MSTEAEKAARRSARAYRASQRREAHRADRASRGAARRARRAARAAARSRAAAKTGALVRRAAPGIGAAVPVLLVNATAFIGQLAWVRDHVPWLIGGQVMFAVAIESVAIFLAWHAHKALLANDSAGRLKAGAYAFALVIGAMNYSHYAVDWHPNALAVALGLMSALSPWLWGVHSRRASRDRLLAQGLVEPHAVRLGASRWLWFPVRSALVTRRAAWEGENNPQRAIAAHEAVRQEHSAARQARRAKVVRQEVTAPAAQPAPVLAQSPAQSLNGSGAVHQLPPVPAPAAPVPAPPAPVVRAIATLPAAPKMNASHDIDPAKVDEVTAYLLGVPLNGLPSERAVAKMLCDQAHDHRRQAKPLIQARKDAERNQDAAPAQPRHSRQGQGDIIATPAATLPGGITG